MKLAVYSAGLNCSALRVIRCRPRTRLSGIICQLSSHDTKRIDWEAEKCWREKILSQPRGSQLKKDVQIIPSEPNLAGKRLLNCRTVPFRPTINSSLPLWSRGLSRIQSSVLHPAVSMSFFGLTTGECVRATHLFQSTYFAALQVLWSEGVQKSWGCWGEVW